MTRKLGRKPAIHEPSLFVHQFAIRELGAGVPSSVPVDVTGGRTTWPLLGNGPDPTCTLEHFNPDGEGDCFEVAIELARTVQAMLAVGLSGALTYENHYKPAHTNYTIGGVYWPIGRWCGETGKYPDEGTNMAKGLQWLQQTGKIKRYGEFNCQQPNALAGIDELLAAGYAVLFGLALPTAYEQQNDAGEPWSGPIDPEAGHCTLLVKSTPAKAQHAVLTWTSVQLVDDAYLLAGGLDECWIVETNEAVVNPKFDNTAWENAIANLPNYHPGTPLESTMRRLEDFAHLGGH